MDNCNLCLVGSGLSRCGAGTEAERGDCGFYFPTGPYSDGCMYHRADLGGACDNANAQHAKRNEGGKHGHT